MITDDTTLVLGKKVSDWRDIYCLMVLREQTVFSLKDLMRWQPPVTPDECLGVGLDLLEARKIDSSLAVQWIETFLIRR